MSVDGEFADQAQTLEDALQGSGWFHQDRMALQAELYEWAASGLPLDDVRGWLAAGVVHAEDALTLRELGVSAERIGDTGLGEQISVGVLSVEDAAEHVLGPLPEPYWVRFFTLADAARLTDEPASWPARVQRLASLLDDQTIPPELLAWARGCDRDDLLDAQEAAEVGAGPLTMEVARRELRRLRGLPARWDPWLRRAVSFPLRVLIVGSLATRELTHRLGMRLEAVIADPPVYLTAALGPYPHGEAAQLLWTRTALEVEAFRGQFAISDPEHALGDPGASMPLDQQQRFRELNRTLAWITLHLEQPATHREGGGVPWTPTEHATTRPLRPDQQLTKELRELAPELPATATAEAATRSDGDLAVAWRLAMLHHLGRDVSELGGDPETVKEQAAACLPELEHRVRARVQAAITRPPTHLVTVLGPHPRLDEVAASWEAMAAAIEEYRLLTETTDPTQPLGSQAWDLWDQCWRQELLLDLTRTRFIRIAHHHLVFGSTAEHAELVDVLASTADPWLGIRPDTAALEEAATLATDELRVRVTVAQLLLAERPSNHAEELRQVQGRLANLQECHRGTRRSLAAARATQNRLRRAIGLEARAARAAATAAVDERTTTLAHLQLCMRGARGELRDLEQAQVAYLAWCAEHGLQAAQGQAAAQELQARQAGLLENLAHHPPAYLLADLGPPPRNRDGRAAWQRGAQAVERYRATYHICDQEQTIGQEPPGVVGTAKQRRQDAESLRRALQEARQAITDSLARELDQGLWQSGPGEDWPDLTIQP
jgi:hypothetical protein